MVCWRNGMSCRHGGVYHVEDNFHVNVAEGNIVNMALSAWRYVVGGDSEMKWRNNGVAANNQ